MQSSIGKLWDKYVQYYLDHYSSPDINKDDGLPYLRDKLFISILLMAFPLCFLAYVPSVIISFKTNEIVIGIFDTAAMLSLTFIFFNRSTGIHLKKIVFSAVFCILAIILIIYMGTKGPGIIILICSSVMITLFEGKQGGIIAVALNTIVYIIVFIFFPLESINLKIYQEYTLISGIGVGINLVIFNTLIVLAVGFLVDHLNESFLKEKNLKSLLKKESQDLLAAKLKAEESDRLKSAFLANMSHEIRIPMNGILGFSYLLGEPGLNRDDRNEYIGLIKKSGDRLINVINQIVDISKIESGLIDLKVREVNINEQIEYVFKLLNPDAEEKNLKLSYKVSLAQEKAFIKTDKEKFYAILSNIVKNAIKYTDEGSIEFGYTLKVNAPVRKAGNKAGPAYKTKELLFFVKDTGIGIPADRQEAIFDRFIQADIDDRQAREGVGLGLAISKSYVEMLNGKLWVESEPGRGSTFYFTLPCKIEVEKEKASETVTPEEKNDIHIANLTILIAEDEEISLILIKQMVSKISKRIIFAKNGIQAVEACRNNPDIDLVLMDLRMPEMDGYEAIIQIRKFNRKVPIIAQTAFVMAEERVLAFKAGCNDFISKPLKKEELLAIIQLNCGQMELNNKPVT
jgi:signal transduction histidine kinase/ActR/RegA family two-component response regulator